MVKKRLGERIKQIFTRSRFDETFFEELEDLLMEADIGPTTTLEVVEELRSRAKTEKVEDNRDLLNLLKDVLSTYITVGMLSISEQGLDIFLVLGVNGVGKTTTIAKLAEQYSEQVGREKVLLSSGDTFRAAAIDQLALHAERLSVDIISQQPGADPGAVIFDTIESGFSRGSRIILADTAGRMHNKANLVKELQKIDKIITKKVPREQYKKLLIIDATTGQNGFRQAEIFHEAIGIDSIILAKYDSTAKGGIAVSISHKLGIPFSFLGTGETYKDLEPFDKERYLNVLLGIS